MELLLGAAVHGHRGDLAQPRESLVGLGGALMGLAALAAALLIPARPRGQLLVDASSS